VLEILNPLTHKIKLTRIDQDENQQTMMFLIKPKSEQALDDIKMAFIKLDPKMNFTVLQYQPLV